MSTEVMIALAVAAVVVLGLVILLMTQQRRKTQLRAQFGPEYQRAVSERGQREAERELVARKDRVAKLHIVELSRSDAEAFGTRWRELQARFVDSPSQTIAEADRLVDEVMQRRGYPVADFEQRAADVSVDHPHFAPAYRHAREIAERNSRNEASTEDMRQALVHYRALFDDLLGDDYSVYEEQNGTREQRRSRRERLAG
jgi:hypothetical protein